MIVGCQRRGAYWTPTGSPGFVQGPKSRGSSATHSLGSSGWSVVKKNGGRVVWHRAREFLRPQGSSYPGPVLWGNAYSPGRGGPPSLVSAVRQGEAGDVAVAGGQPVLHEALCLVCGPALQGNDGQGGGEGTQVGLEDCEESGQGVYAGAAPAHGDSEPPGHRH